MPLKVVDTSYTSMFETPKNDGMYKDKKIYKECLYDTTGKMTCTDWFITKHGYAGSESNITSVATTAETPSTVVPPSKSSYKSLAQFQSSPYCCPKCCQA